MAHLSLNKLIRYYVVFNNIDFETYLKDYPDDNDYFGRYKGNIFIN